MICRCGTEMRVRRTYPSGTDKDPTTSRVNECLCGMRYLSEERIVRTLAISSLSNGVRTAVDSPSNGGLQPVERRSVARLQDGSVPNGGSGGSDLDPKPPESGPVSDLRLDLFQQVDPARVSRVRKGVESYSSNFLTFWEAYPRKEAKGAAWKAWAKLIPPVDKVLGALVWQRMSQAWTKDGGQFVPLPSTYLNARRWEDERHGGGNGVRALGLYREIPPLPPGAPRPR